MRTAPAQPRHDTDHESSWWRGTVWSLAKNARTDWWKTSRDSSTKTPAYKDGGSDGINKYLVLGFTTACCLHRPDRMKQMDAGFRKNRISLLRDMVMQMAPIAIRKRLNKANIAAATLRSDQKETTVVCKK